MAIIIPSKRIYEIDNPKVIENALKSIEVEINQNSAITQSNANPLKQDLDFSTTSDTTYTERYDRRIPTSTYGTGYMFSGGIKSKIDWCALQVELARRAENSYITEIAPQINVTFDVKISKVLAISYYGAIPTGSKRFDFNFEKEPLTSRQSLTQAYSYSLSDISYDYDANFKLQNDISITPDGANCVFTVLTTVTTATEDSKMASYFELPIIPTNIDHTFPYSVSAEETAEKYTLSVDFAKNFTLIVANDYASSSEENSAISRPVEATKIELIAKSVEIVYNEKVRSLAVAQTNEVYSNLSAEGEATYSIGDNQFVRDNTTYSGGINATGTLYNHTLELYRKGKEIATLLCSVGEYYDENGKLVISTKTADKMTFEHYDRVVPMVRNAWGTDSPISLNANGNAKVFEVVGVRVLADGAVWQELKMREVGEVAIVVQLPPPILRIVGDTLQITDISGKAEEFDVYVNGGLVATITATEYDLSALGLPYGSHTVWAVARASGYKQSAKSQSLWYILQEQLSTTYYTEVNSANGLTYFITSNDYTVVNGTYKIGEQG